MYLSGSAPYAAVHFQAREPSYLYASHSSRPPVLAAVVSCLETPVELWLPVTVAAVSLLQKCVQ